MNSNVAQRRGKVPENKTATVLISEEKQRSQPPDESMPVEIKSGAAPPPVTVARVRRNFCGTGPFDRYWLNLDCCGLFCALFTYGLHLYGVYAVTLILLPPWMSYKDETTGERHMTVAGVLHRTLFTAIAAIAIISHFKAMTTDPGAVPPDAKPLDLDEQENITNSLDESTSSQAKSLLDPPPAAKQPPKVKRLCRRCKAFKPARAHHCSICRRCIIKMDHHCPWVNNCVGIGNHKYFLLFVFYTFVSCCYSLILVIARFSTCGWTLPPGPRRRRHHHGGLSAAETAYEQTQHHEHITCLDKPTQLLSVLGLLIEAVLFGMFTSCMMFDQADVVRSKVTHIDKFKGADVSGGLSGVTEVFGTGNRGVDARFRADWLSPFVRVCFPSSVQDEIMGFGRPCQATANGMERMVDAAKAAVGSLGGGNRAASSTNSRPAGAVSMTEIV